MMELIVNTFAEVADFFIGFWVDKVIEKFAEKKKRSAKPKRKTGSE